MTGKYSQTKAEWLLKGMLKGAYSNFRLVSSGYYEVFKDSQIYLRRLPKPIRELPTGGVRRRQWYPPLGKSQKVKLRENGFAKGLGQ